MSTLHDYREILDISVHSSGHVVAKISFLQEWNPEKSNLCNTMNGYSLCNYDRFPESFASIMETSQVRQLRLSYVKGLWDTSLWGTHPMINMAGGQNLWALIPAHEALKNWNKLRCSLSGLYGCSLSKETKLFSPSLMPILFDSISLQNNTETPLVQLHDSLPRESVCTDIFSRVLHTLPCRDKAGFGMLLNPLRIVNSAYYSMFTAADALWEGNSTFPSSIMLNHTLVLVFGDQVVRKYALDYSKFSLNFSLSSLFQPDYAFHTGSKQVLAGRVKSLLQCPSSWDSILSLRYPEFMQNLSKNDTFFKFYQLKENSDTIYAELQFSEGKINLEQLIMDTTYPVAYAIPKSENSSNCNLVINNYISAKGGLSGTFLTNVKCSRTIECKITYLQVFPRFIEPLFHTFRASIKNQNSRDAVLLDELRKYRIHVGDAENLSGLEVEIDIPPGNEFYLELKV